MSSPWTDPLLDIGVPLLFTLVSSVGATVEAAQGLEHKSCTDQLGTWGKLTELSESHFPLQ